MTQPPEIPKHYTPQWLSQSQWLSVRGWRYHVHRWSAAHTPATSPLLVLLHGWMDVGASYQFLVDAIFRREGAIRDVVAPDWRGFGRTSGPETDSYWFADYYADLDALLDQLSPHTPVDLCGHSMGGNVVMGYAGIRPHRVRRLINLEGFGMPQTRASQAPTRLAQWLDELREPQSFKDYDSLDSVAQRLQSNNPRLSVDKASWLAPHWSRPRADGRWEIQGDPAHKRVHPQLYRWEENEALWQRIRAPLLWVQGDDNHVERWWKGRYTLAEFQQRLKSVACVEQEVLPHCGHMLHHDQPEALAQRLLAFLDAPAEHFSAATSASAPPDRPPA